MGKAPVLRVCEHPRRLAVDAPWLRVDRLLERQLFAAVTTRELVVGVRAVDRVAHERDQLDVWERREDALWHVRMEEVVRARLAGDPA